MTILTYPKWYKRVKRPGGILIRSQFTYGGLHYFKEILGIDQNIANWKSVKNELYFCEQERDLLQKEIQDRIGSDKNFIKNYLERSYKQCEKLLAAGIEIEKLTNLEKFSKKELLGYFTKFNDEICKTTPVLIGTTVGLGPVLERLLNEKLKEILEQRNISEKFDYYFSLAEIPKQENHSAVELKNILKITIKINDTPKLKQFFEKDTKEIVNQIDRHDIYKEIKEHLKENSWISTAGAIDDPWTVEELIDRIKNTINSDCEAKLIHIGENKKKNEKEIQQMFEDLNPGQDFIDFIQQLRQTIHLRTYRTDAIYRTHFRVRNLLTEIGRRMNLGLNDVLYMTFQEIISFLTNMPSYDEIKQRSNGFDHIIMNGSEYWIYGEELEKFREQYGKEDYSDINEVKGHCANKGFVKGPAKVIKNPKEINKIQKDDILVVNMTNPCYVIAMEKAAAFVTDEGGILCHAAVISREMQKPCIISTKIATKVFKDGDMIEVDAENGIARKIE